MPAYTGRPGRSHRVTRTRKGFRVYDERKGTYSGPGGSPAATAGPALPSSPTSSSTSRSPRRRPSLARQTSTSGLTSLAANYLMNGITDLLTPDPDQAEYNLSSELGSALQKLSSGAEALEDGLGESLSQDPRDPFGKHSLGDLSLPQMLRAAQKGTAQVNRAGKITIPATRQAARQLSSAREQVRETARPDLRGLDPAEREVVKYARKAHRKYPDVPTSLLMSLMRQESGFQADAVSSADAQGLTQFIPSTAASYGVQYGTGRREKQSQVTGAAKLLTDSDFATDPKGALTRYTGGYSDAEYNDPVLQGAADYAALDRRSKPDPVAAERLKQAKAQAQSLGIPTKPRTPAPEQRFGPPDKQTLTRFRAGVVAAKELDAAKLPYVWGGGHGDPKSRPTGGGLDCSGAVSYVLNKMGAMKGSLVSGDMGQVLKPGPGAVTVFYNPTHTFMKIGNRFFGTSRTNPGGGPGFIEGKPDDLSKYNVGHVPGMGGKVAVQLGVDLSGAQGGGGGIVYGPEGTTATVVEGTTKDQAGFSDRPITASVSPIDAPTAAQAPLPEAFEQFQGGGEAEGEAEDVASIIQNILRGRRL